MVERHQSPRVISDPEPCFVRLRLERNGPYLPARIYRTWTGLWGEIDGNLCDADRVWTSGDLITEREWRELTRDRKREKPF